jgi:hypothetical protein
MAVLHPLSPGYAAVRSCTFVSACLQREQQNTNISGSPPTFVSVLTSFIGSPQSGHRGGAGVSDAI